MFDHIFTCEPTRAGKTNELDLIFKVTKVLQNSFHLVSEEIFDIVSPNLVPRGTRERLKVISAQYLKKYIFDATNVHVIHIGTRAR